MNFNLKLKKNQGFPWFNYKDKIYVKGFVYSYDNKILKGFNFVSFIKDKLFKKEQLIEFIKELNGSFTIIIKKNEEMIIISDKVNSFPIFYKLSNNDGAISDDCEELVGGDTKLIQFNLDQLIFAGYVIGNETIYENIFQTRASEILSLNNNKYYRSTYFYLVNSSDEDFGLGFYHRKYLNVINNIGLRLVNGAENRQLLLLLSAGYDSRLIANMLHQHNYNNVIAVTYGVRDTFEKDSAQKVANKLGFEWHFIEYSNEQIRKSISKMDFIEFAKFSANGTSRPHIQDIFVIDKLLNDKVIDSKTIILNGNRPRIYISKYVNETEKLMNLSKLEIIDHLINSDFITNDKKIKLNLRNKVEKELFEGSVIDQLDDWNHKEFISKFLFNLTRNYNFFRLEYRVPLLDDELVNFIKDLPLHYKQEYQFYPTVNNELIFKLSGTDFTNSAYSEVKKYRLVNYLLNKKLIKLIIKKYLEGLMFRYRDPNNFKFIIETIYPKYRKARTRDEWYNQNISRWYIEQIVNKSKFNLI